MRHFCAVFCFLVCCSITPAASPIDDHIRFDGWSKWARSLLDRSPYFLDREVLITLPVPAPPANSSAETRAELDQLLDLQQTRTREQLRAIKNHREYDGVCAAVLAAVHRDLTHA